MTRSSGVGLVMVVFMACGGTPPHAGTQDRAAVAVAKAPADTKAPADAKAPADTKAPLGDSPEDPPAPVADAPSEDAPEPIPLDVAKAKAKGEIMHASVIDIDGVPTPLVVTKEERETADDVITIVSARLHEPHEVHVFRQRGFDQQVNCEALDLLPSPPGMTVLATPWCDPWSCGGGCLHTQQILFVAHEAPKTSRWIELSCNENLSPYPDAEINDACDQLHVSKTVAEITLETTHSKPCSKDEAEGRIRRATVRRSTMVLSPTGTELRQGKLEAYRRDLWGCKE